MIFLELSGKMIFLFPKNMILFSRQKMKDDLCQKNTWKYDLFFKYSEKIAFSEKPHWNMIFLVLSGKMVIFLPENVIFFLWTENERWSFSRNTQKYDVFCVKKSKTIFSRENKLKVIVILHWHSRKSSNDSLHFYGDLHRRFHILISSEKKKNQET